MGKSGFDEVNKKILSLREKIIEEVTKTIKKEKGEKNVR
jgi:hypothetical protein